MTDRARHSVRAVEVNQKALVDDSGGQRTARSACANVIVICHVFHPKVIRKEAEVLSSASLSYIPVRIPPLGLTGIVYGSCSRGTGF